jgi:hypothetical protein
MPTSGSSLFGAPRLAVGLCERQASRSALLVTLSLSKGDTVGSPLPLGAGSHSLEQIPAKIAGPRIQKSWSPERVITSTGHCLK